MSSNPTCAIWNMPATKIPVIRDGQTFDSPRAGGRYFISGSAEALLEHTDNRAKARLTTWLVEQRRLGTSCPEISPETVGDAKQRRDANIFDRVDGILRYLARRSKTLGTLIGYRHPLTYPPPLDSRDEVYLELLAHSECVSLEDLDFLLAYLKKRGWIEWRGADIPERACILTVEGYARLAELEKSNTASSRAFVAMWFDESMNESWEHGFDPAIRGVGYEPVRVDRREYVNKIDDEIIAEIRRARFVVADFTQGDKGARGGVYYEAGFAHGLGIPVIFTCRKDSFDHVHLDTRQYNHIVWTGPEELQRNLANRIAAVIGEGPNRLLV